MPSGEQPKQREYSTMFWPIFWTVVVFTGAAGFYVGCAPFFAENPMTMAETKALEASLTMTQLGFGTILGLLGGRLLH